MSIRIRSLLTTAFLILTFLGGCAIIPKRAHTQKTLQKPEPGSVAYKIDMLASQITRLYDVNLSEGNFTAPDKNISVSKSEAYVKITIPGNIMFKKGSRYLLKKARTLISRMIPLVKYNKTLAIQVVGHTDSSGSKRVNQTLSDARAISVAELFYAKGVKNALYAKGCGARKPLFPNRNDRQKALNRRVEILIYPDKSMLQNPCR